MFKINVTDSSWRVNEISRKWPKNCKWPAPIGTYGGGYWDEDTVPSELNEYAQELVDIKDYYDELVEAGRLDENYYLNEEYADTLAKEEDEDFWVPEEGEEFWYEDHFDIDIWREELSDELNKIKIDTCVNDPTITIHRILGYYFVNENLLRQAFTRRAFQIEYGMTGSSEELEFYGDSVLSFIASKEMARNLGEIHEENTESPFQSKLDEGGLSRLKSTFVCKEHLAKRCEELGLDQFILYGTGEVPTESAKEDAIEALIGAVAMDCNWNMDVLDNIVDRLVSMHIDEPEQYLKKSYYELFNSWHMRHFGKMPEYLLTKRARSGLYCTMKFGVPVNDRGILARPITESGESRSKARERAAERAYYYIVDQGLWMNLENAGVVPKPYEAINQLQELYQKLYIEEPEYEFSEQHQFWNCDCIVNGVAAFGYGSNKTVAKKMAAYKALIMLLKSAGCCKDEWFQQMIELTSSGMFEQMKSEAPKREGLVKSEAKCKIGIKYTAVAEILEQIEPGKVITEKVLVAWVEKITGIDALAINWKEFPYPHLREEDIPFHRFLTAKGLVDVYYKDRLIEEGHEVVPTKTTNWRVLDYKDCMVDVGMLVLPEDAIGVERGFRENVKSDVKDALM